MTAQIAAAGPRFLPRESDPNRLRAMYAMRLEYSRRLIRRELPIKYLAL
jgi:hypothetical protein